MNHDLIPIMALFRIGSRHVPRTISEVAGILGLENKTAENRIGQLRKLGYLTTEKAHDAAGLVRLYLLSDRGKAWLAMQPQKRGRVLTAVPR